MQSPQRKVKMPLVEAMNALDMIGLKMINNGGASTAEKLISICDKLSDRLQSVIESEDLVKTLSVNIQWQPIHKTSLAPCTEVNKYLSLLVGIVLKPYSANVATEIMTILRREDAKSGVIRKLREISVKSEEAMEKDALSLIFSVLRSNCTYKPDILILSEKHIEKYMSLFSSVTHATQVAILKSLVVDYPRMIQNQNPVEHKGMPFKYFDNYTSIVLSELQLLNIPFLLQNEKQTSCSSVSDMFARNPFLSAIISLIERPDSNEDIKKFTTDFINDFPEFFGVTDLSSKCFTFVGAGFPLTAIILHIISDGASINLVDYDREAVINAKKLLITLENLRIVKKGSIEIYHEDATNVLFIPPVKFNHEHVYSKFNPSLKNRTVIPTDILDLASALSSKDTASIMLDNGSTVEIIRKRTAKGISTLLYEPFNAPPSANFNLVGEVVPPQMVLSRAVYPDLVTGFMDCHNINSTQLYVNTLHMEEKYRFLTSTLPALIEAKMIGGDNVRVQAMWEHLHNKCTIWDNSICAYYSV